MSIDKMREEFETWAANHYVLMELSTDFEDGEYVEPDMQYAWEAWQASREGLEIADLHAAKNTVECRFEVSENTLKTIRGCLASAEGDIDQLKADNKALRKDAERYRWLREAVQSDFDVSYDMLELRLATPHHDSDDLDACIDAAMISESKA